MMTVDEMVARAKTDGASDIHIICGLPPKYRKDGQLENMCEDVLTEADCIDLCRQLCGEQFDETPPSVEIDSAGMWGGNRCRVHIFRQQGQPSVALRLLRESIPQLEKLGLPVSVRADPDAVLAAALHDKKMSDGKITAIKVPSPGSFAMEPVSPEELGELIKMVVHT